MNSIDTIKLYILDKVSDPGIREADNRVSKQADWLVFAHTQLYLDHTLKIRVSDLVERTISRQRKRYTSKNIKKVIDVFY